MENSVTPAPAQQTGTSENQAEVANIEQAVEDILDLGGVSRFRFKGIEMTPEDLDKSVMRQADYTRKTQAIAEERKYTENFLADVKKVEQNPQLMNEFRKLYPAKYQQLAENYLEATLSKQELKQKAEKTGVPEELLEELRTVREYVRNQEVQKHEAQLETTISSLKKEFPISGKAETVIETYVLSKAQILSSKGIQITNEIFKTLWKEGVDSLGEYGRTVRKQVSNNQRMASAKAKDTGAGGGVPIAPPREPKSLKEAHAMADEYFRNKQR